VGSVVTVEMASGSDASLMRPLPIRDHPVADIPRVAQRLGPAGPTIRASPTALGTIAGEIIRARARVPGRQIGGNTLDHELFDASKPLGWTGSAFPGLGVAAPFSAALSVDTHGYDPDGRY
jgi:hypothetical protein